ncbi:hypothetical protein CDA63_00085 [Hymenobacter amundsenii]|uniref:Lipoprotein n=1 Tax=Hymenobacter amundsenii TaxID=2006685 RepID=A0A246FPY5_9BACT|nr:hypothetical protein [Hymenobacter amundsenii]OWP64798.1 hypothetical protein CDA63_00085 [Hymenobacter amundsenii]
MKFLPALLLAGICLAACTKRDAAPTIDFGPNGGITQRDASGKLFGTIDTTDWTADTKNWNKQERALFTLPLDVNAPYILRTIPGEFGPNPSRLNSTSGFSLYGIPFNAMWELAFVDKNYKVVDRQKYGPFKVADVRFPFEFPADKFASGTTYRVYYVVYSTNSPASSPTLFLKGHGDISLIQ